MPNHYHVLVRISAPNLGLMMRRLNGAYAWRFNKIYGRRGYLFMDRYKSLAAQTKLYFKELVAYIHLNPVRAGLVPSLEQLLQYPWSSHRDYLGKPRHSWLYAREGVRHFAGNPGDRLRAYVAFLEGRLECEGTLPSWVHDSDGSPPAEDRVAGDPEFIRAALERERGLREHRKALRARGIGMDEVAERVALALRVDPQQMKRRSRHGLLSQARALTAYLARQELGLSLREIGDYLDLSAPATSLAASRGEALAVKGGDKIKL
jgi:hypothetical protein